MLFAHVARDLLVQSETTEHTNGQDGDDDQQQQGGDQHHAALPRLAMRSRKNHVDTPVLFMTSMTRVKGIVCGTFNDWPARVPYSGFANVTVIFTETTW